MDLAAARCLFAPDPGYLNTATVGVPPRTTTDAMTEVLEAWRRGQLAAREIDVDRVAVGSTVSAFVGVIAAALPDGARVVTAQGEFASLLFPFLAHADRGVTVEELPLEELAGFSGAADLVDTTQSCGWLPLDCAAFDYVACTAYKWLLPPRGTAFLHVRDEARLPLRPLAAGWYAGELPWESIYGSPLRLASLDAEAVRAHDVGLANAFCSRLGLPAADSAIVVVEQAGAEAALAVAGVRTAFRAGHVRAAFHLYNDERDVDLAVGALTGS